MKNRKIQTLIPLLILSLFSLSRAFAADPVAEADEKLQQERMHAESVNAANQQALSDIAAQKAALDVKQREILESADKNLAAVQEEFTPVMMYNMMTLPNNYSPCTIVPQLKQHPEDRQEYFITGNDQNGNKMTLRFFFNEKRTLLAPTMKPYLMNDGSHLTEINQPNFDPTNESKKGYMYAVIRYIPKAQTADGKVNKIVHAVFGGERIFDGFMGIGSSNTPDSLACMIMVGH